MGFMENLKSLRYQKHIYPADLASALKKSESAIRMWEIGRSKPDIDTLVKIAEFFNCTTDYLLGLEDFPDKDTANMVMDLEESQMSVLQALSGENKELYYQLNKYILDSFLLAQNKETSKYLFFDTLKNYLELLLVFYMTRHDTYPASHFKQIESEKDKVQARIKTALELKHDINLVIHELLGFDEKERNLFEIDYEKYIEFWN